MCGFLGVGEKAGSGVFAGIGRRRSVKRKSALPEFRSEKRGGNEIIAALRLIGNVSDGARFLVAG
jgi:hypothetical protein